MRVVLLNDTRADPNPGCQATVSVLVRQLAAALDARVTTRPRGEGYDAFAPLIASGAAHDAVAWSTAVDRLAADSGLADALCSADLVVANLEGTFHHHTVGALALGGTLALAHRLGRPVWALNGTVEGIDRWLLDLTLVPAAHVSVREPRSARWLAARGLHATLAADAAFLAAPFLARSPAAPAAGRVFYTPGVLAGLLPSRTEAVSAILEDLHAVASTGRRPVLAWLEDREAPLAAAIAARGWATLDLRPLPWTGIGRHLRGFDLVISGRYHVLVFAAMAGRPFLARPSNTHKIEGLLEHLGREAAMIADAAALSRELSRGLPPPVPPGTIARCQELARSAVPRADGTPAQPIVEGLDWVPAADLPEVLSAVRRTASLPLTTSLAAVPWAAGSTAFARVAPLDDWHATLGRAGLELAVTGFAGPEGSSAHEGASTEPVPGSASNGIGQYVVRLSATVPRADTLPASDFVVCAIVGDEADLAHLAPSLRAAAPNRRRAIVRAEDQDTPWRLRRREIVAWCRSLDADVIVTDDPRVVDWHLAGRPGVLVCSGAQAPEHPRTWQGAFETVARRRGWRLHLVGADGRALPPCLAPGHADALRVPARVALFGASSLGRRKAAEVRARRDLVLVGVFDNDPARWGATFEDVPVLRPEAAALADVDLILVSSMHQHAIARQVIDAGCGRALVLDLAAVA
ncbi:MAG: polysaccharide pyruvyl transferase family protein [Acidobacteria bacterium]|nr:polysaccharide pyruvyl transferase family protein [Acidobacteriota bacterium]